MQGIDLKAEIVGFAQHALNDTPRQNLVSEKDKDQTISKELAPRHTPALSADQRAVSSSAEALEDALQTGPSLPTDAADLSSYTDSKIVIREQSQESVSLSDRSLYSKSDACCAVVLLTIKFITIAALFANAVAIPVLTYMNSNDKTNKHFLNFVYIVPPVVLLGLGLWLTCGCGTYSQMKRASALCDNRNTKESIAMTEHKNETETDQAGNIETSFENSEPDRSETQLLIEQQDSYLNQGLAASPDIERAQTSDQGDGTQQTQTDHETVVIVHHPQAHRERSEAL